MHRVLKWNVPVDDKPHEIGSGPVSHVACQYGPESVQVWTLESEPVPFLRTVLVLGTGHSAPGNSPVPLGSAVTAGGALVWHVVQLDTTSEETR